MGEISSSHCYDQLRFKHLRTNLGRSSKGNPCLGDVTSERPLQLVAALLPIEALLLYNWASL